MRWDVICVQDLNRQVVYSCDDKGRAEAKANRLNRLSPPSVKYIVEEGNHGEKDRIPGQQAG